MLTALTYTSPSRIGFSHWFTKLWSPLTKTKARCVLRISPFAPFSNTVSKYSRGRCPKKFLPRWKKGPQSEPVHNYPPMGTNICSARKCTRHSRSGQWSLTFKSVKPTEEKHLRGAVVTKKVTVQRRRGGSSDVPNRSHYQREPTCVLHRHTEHFGHKCSLRGSKIVFSNSPKS